MAQLLPFVENRQLQKLLDFQQSEHGIHELLDKYIFKIEMKISAIRFSSETYPRKIINFTIRIIKSVLPPSNWSNWSYYTFPKRIKFIH